MTGLMPNPDGSTTPVTTDERIRAATALSPFVMPRLQSTQMMGADGGPIATATLNMNALLADAETLELAQALSIKLSLGGRDPEQAALPAPSLIKNDRGHYQAGYGQTDPEAE